MTKIAIALAACLVSIALLAPASSASSGSVPLAWRQAADTLSIPVFAPTKTLGLKLKRVDAFRGELCGQDDWQQLAAQYGSLSARRNVSIYEGHPAYCGDLGDVTVEGHVRIHGKLATVYGNCAAGDCDRRHSYDVSWCERGTKILLAGSIGISKCDLIALGRSMRQVGSAPALHC